VKERDVLRVVGDLLDLHGWRWWHVPMPVVAERSGRGFRPYKRAAGLPDIFALHDVPPRMLILELKGKGGKLSDDQREFLKAAADVASRTYQPPQTWALDDISPVTSVSTGKAVGVYVVEPHSLDAIEQVIRTRVVT
jgi:hypothetical protein